MPGVSFAGVSCTHPVRPATVRDVPGVREVLHEAGSPDGSRYESCGFCSPEIVSVMDASAGELENIENFGVKSQHSTFVSNWSQVTTFHSTM